MIRFENVGLRYGLGPEVLRDISFHLEPGGFHFLTGPSGAGKTSLLKLMFLALRPSRGLITMFGNDLATTSRQDLPALRRTRAGADQAGRTWLGLTRNERYVVEASTRTPLLPGLLAVLLLAAFLGLGWWREGR